MAAWRYWPCSPFHREVEKPQRRAPPTAHRTQGTTNSSTETIRPRSEEVEPNGSGNRCQAEAAGLQGRLSADAARGDHQERHRPAGYGQGEAAGRGGRG